MWFYIIDERWCQGFSNVTFSAVPLLLTLCFLFFCLSSLLPPPSSPYPLLPLLSPLLPLLSPLSSLLLLLLLLPLFKFVKGEVDEAFVSRNNGL